MESVPGLEYCLPAALSALVRQLQRLQVFRPNVGQDCRDPVSICSPELQREVFEVDVSLDGCRETLKSDEIDRIFD